MKKEHGVVIDDATSNLIKALQEKEPGDYAAVIVSHVDKIVPTILFVLSPPLTLGVLYFIVKPGTLAHPMLVFFAVLGMLGSLFFAIKYDYALKTCRYSGIGLAMAENKNLELKKENRALLQRVASLETQPNGQMIKDEDIRF